MLLGYRHHFVSWTILPNHHYHLIHLDIAVITTPLTTADPVTLAPRAELTITAELYFQNMLGQITSLSLAHFLIYLFPILITTL